MLAKGMEHALLTGVRRDDACPCIADVRTTQASLVIPYDNGNPMALRGAVFDRTGRLDEFSGLPIFAYTGQRPWGEPAP